MRQRVKELITTPAPGSLVLARLAALGSRLYAFFGTLSKHTEIRCEGASEERETYAAFGYVFHLEVRASRHLYLALRAFVQYSEMMRLEMSLGLHLTQCKSLGAAAPIACDFGALTHRP